MVEVISIDLPQKVSGETLEEACIKAAQEIGYKTKPVDEFIKRYTLGSIQEHKDYYKTSIRVGNIFPALQVENIKKGERQDYFSVIVGFPIGFASKKKVKEYLSLVSKYL